jgi:cell division protein FtsB
MKLSSREKLLVLLLPLVAVLGSYAWWFNMVQRPRLAKLQKDYAAAVAGAVQPMTVLEQRAELAKTQREVAALEQRRSDLQRQAHELSCSYLDPQQRHRVEEQLTAVFRRHRLRLIEEAPAGKGEAGKLPKTLTDAVSRLGPAATSSSEHVRTFKLSGSFLDLLHAVRDLSASETAPGVPIGVSMDEVDQEWPSESRVWTLLVWM